MEHARFSIEGQVTRVWASESGKFAKLSVASNVDGKRRIIELRGFSDTARIIGGLKEGANVVVTGDVEMNPLKDKTKQDVKVDGFNKWIVELTAREVKRAAGSKAPPAQALPEPSDDLPF